MDFAKFAMIGPETAGTIETFMRGRRCKSIKLIEVNGCYGVTLQIEGEHFERTCVAGSLANAFEGATRDL